MRLWGFDADWATRPGVSLTPLGSSVQQGPHIRAIDQIQKYPVSPSHPQRCACCGALLGQPLLVHPCLACPLALFCSPACRTWHPFHTAGGRECGRAWPRLLPGNSLLALRLVLVRREATGPAAWSLARLTGGTHLFGAEEKLVGAVAACLTALCWAGPEDGGMRTGARACLPLAEAVYHASGQVRLNAFGLHPPWNSGRDEAYAQAIYPTASLANHACRPNISVHFEVRQAPTGRGACFQREGRVARREGCLPACCCAGWPWD